MTNKINSIKLELNNEILWRYKEVKNIIKLFEQHSQKEIISIGSYQKERIINTPESKYILRSAIPMIYAHWEGFFKKAIELLNSHLDIIEIDFNKLNIMLLSILLKDKHTQKSLDMRLKFTEIIIDTKSNLDWKVLEKFLYRYNLNRENFEKYSAKINELVKIRNGIAHGENAYHFEDIQKIDDYLLLVIKLMIITKTSVINCLKYKKYYKQSYKE